MKPQLLSLLSLLPIAASASDEQAQKPNVLIIMVDGMQQQRMSFLGNTELRTPSIDWLAHRGVSFGGAYCSHPLSTPARCSLLTGQYASTFNLRFNLENSAYRDAVDWDRLDSVRVDALGNVFKRAGYDTYYGGTTSLASRTDITDPEPYGFDVNFSKERHEQLGRDAAALMSSLTHSDKPYLMFVSFINPHNIGQFGDYLNLDSVPFDSLSPKKQEGVSRLLKYTSPYPDGQVPKHLLPRVPANAERMQGEPDCLPIKPSDYTEEQWRLCLWLYNRLIEEVDYNISPIVNLINRKHLLDNTIVVFMADHGESCSAHRREHKSVPFEEAERIPFIIAGPDIPRNTINNEAILNLGIDFLPTLCDLAGIEVPRGLPGQDFTVAAQGGRFHNRKYHYFEGPNWDQVLCRGRYKYTLFDSGEEILVDLRKDPLETRNIASSHPRLCRKLAERLKAHCR